MAEGEVTQQDDAEAFARVLGRAVRALEREGVPYAVFGSLVSDLFGRPAPSGDIDLLVRPGDADRALDALASEGFTTERLDPTWIYKACLQGVLVDVIFRLKGDIYLDDEVMEHTRVVDLAGHDVRVISPEDAAMIEAVSNEAQSPDHWYNAVGIVARSDLDWDYLLRRARHAARRVLSLLVYCDSTDVPIPSRVIAALFESTYS
ncbi:MAG TPA: nucleotidyltransferase [Actinomycetota bacterium]|nr:nucleotidyltransferase [Actinomycetota bacterium]